MLWRLLIFTLAGPALGVLVPTAISLPFGKSLPDGSTLVLALGIAYMYGAIPLLVIGLVDHVLSYALPAPYRVVATAMLGALIGIGLLSLMGVFAPVFRGVAGFGFLAAPPALVCSALSAWICDRASDWEDWAKWRA